MIPPAALYLPDYITASEQADLLADIDASPWRDDLKRRVQHYGYRYDYKARRVTADSYLGPLPDWLARMAMALADTGLFPARPDQVIVNEYQPGQGIAPHVDCEPCFGDVIASLSLGSGCAMLFSAPDQDTLSHISTPAACSCYAAHRASIGPTASRHANPMWSVAHPFLAAAASP